ncbi:MAG: hypothetical protein P8R42_02435 [Candidatus Binatia bacterium]|nr:hypothetical protein [Candidatus Binatia bacterium]
MRTLATRWMTTTLGLILLMSPGVSAAAADGWTPADWIDTETIELGTTAPGEELYSFPVWLVVIDGDVYVRLGNRAADQVNESTTKPYMPVKIAGQKFAKVEGIPAPDKAEQVEDLMAEKYWSDLFIRFFPHPLTLRLEPH